MAKPNLKSVRMSDLVLNTVNQVKGDGFNEKFENLVTEFYYTIPKREEKLKNIEKSIKEKEAALNHLQSEIANIIKLAQSLNSLYTSYDFKSISESLNKLRAS
ncbi:hypothetical protein [Dehalobacter sp. TeCB1]|uniref:hypothetical protein n=1 Tax=Dehalobacter sp. TeCB1 TaxID=1843715 RepID=UPI000839F1CE|nr:hypothetical protein [Dehalobacter sp. TeCB1]OCZ50841.1 hypothetical protein A7D23_14165 [Dehalobacter sp. TeCB1]